MISIGAAVQACYLLIIKKSTFVLFVFVISLSVNSLFQINNQSVSAQVPSLPVGPGSAIGDNNNGTQTPSSVPGSAIGDNNNGTQTPSSVPGSAIVGNVTGFLGQTVNATERAVKTTFGEGAVGLLVLIIIAVIAITGTAVAVSKSRGRHHPGESPPPVLSDHKNIHDNSEHFVEIKTEGGLE